MSRQCRSSAILYRLPCSGPIKWNANQEKHITQHDTPLCLSRDGDLSLEEQTRRLYLQFLWLPDALMPLTQMVIFLLSLSKGFQSSTVHPLHAALDSVILTDRWCSYKYHEHLPKILEDDPKDDIEHQMMSFAQQYSRAEDHEPSPAKALHSEEERETSPETWLESMEKREVQIQIILHFIKLCLPGPCPSPPMRPLPEPPRKRRKIHHRPSSSESEVSTPVQIMEDRLESLMDRLVLWQMALPTAPTEDRADGENATSNKEPKDLRDWTQTFCDDVVGPSFGSKLPELYRLLRMKLFRIPQWSEDEEDDIEETAHHNTSRPTSSLFTPDTSFAAGPLRSSSSRLLSRSRSRSLSVSLVQEAEARRAGNSRTLTLQREVSMSRVFKDKTKIDKEKSSEKLGRARSGHVDGQGRNGLKREDTVLVTETPVKVRSKPRHEPTILVSETPSKKKMGRGFSSANITIKGEDYSEDEL